MLPRPQAPNPHPRQHHQLRPARLLTPPAANAPIPPPTHPPPPRSGQLQLRFVWEVTARSLLTIKLHALERVLAQRQEILAALQPVPAEVGGWALPWLPMGAARH